MTLRDQMGRSVMLERPALRIVSLVPSQTELLYDLGLRDEVVGITRFCIYPEEWYRTKMRVGGTKNVNLERVRALQPDLIIGNKEENTASDIARLEEIAPVWMSDIFTLEDALQMIEAVGEMTGKSCESREMVQGIIRAFDDLHESAAGFSVRGVKVAYFIWDNPSMLAGKNTFIDDMLSRCGWENVTKESRYPEVHPDIRPDLVLLSSEPFPFAEPHLEKYRRMYPEAMVSLADGEFFSWYGSRLLKAPEYFKSLSEELSAQRQPK